MTLILKALLVFIVLFVIAFIGITLFVVFRLTAPVAPSQRFRIEPVAMGTNTIWQIHERRPSMSPVFLGYRNSREEAQEFVELLAEARAGV